MQSFLRLLFFLTAVLPMASNLSAAIVLHVAPATLTVQPGQTVTVNVTVDGFTDIAAYQFSMQWDPAVLQFQSIGYNLAGLSASAFNTSSSASGVLSTAFMPAPAATLPDGSSLFSLQFMAIGAAGSSTDLAFTNLPTAIAFYNSAVQKQPVTVLAGQMGIQSAGNFSVTGNIRRNSGPAVPGATVNMTGTSTGSDLTNSAGNYLFPNLSAGSNLTLTPVKSTNFTECVSVRDMLFISKHILALQPLGSPYQIIEADVNKNGGLTQLDILMIRDLILGKSTQFVNNDSWRFVPADFVFPTPNNPFLSTFPETSTITNLQSDAVQDFIGMKIGDATDCAGDAHGPAFLTLSVQSRIAEVGSSNFNVNIRSQGLTNVSGLQFTLTWDPAVIQFTSASSPLPGWANANYFASTGSLSVCWADVTPQSLPDGSVVFTLLFNAIGSAGAVSPIVFTENPTRSEVVNGLCNPFDLNRVNGSVELAFPPCSVTCNDLVNVALGNNCEAAIGPDEILEGFICPGTYTMDVRDANNVLLLSDVSTAVLNSSMNDPLTVSVTLQPWGNTCFAQVRIQDNMPPICIAPPNVVTDCEHFDRSLQTYGIGTATDNCCLTAFTETSTGEVSCNGGTIVRRFRADDCNGGSATCTQIIVVQPVGTAGFYVKFPDDVVTNDCSVASQEPVVEALGCSQVAFGYVDDVFTVVPDACFRINRTWSVIDWCTFDGSLPFVQIPNPRPNVTPDHPLNLIGPTVAAAGAASPWMPTISALVPGGPPVDFSTFWSAGSGYKYVQTIKVTDTAPPVIDPSFGPNDAYDITNNDPDLWSGSGWFDPVSSTANLEDAAASLQIGTTDNCFSFNSNVNISYLLFLDLDQNGTLETVVNSQNLPGFNNINFNNAFNAGYAGGTPRPFDNRSVAAADKYGFALEVVPAGSGFLANVRWNTQNAPGTYVDPQLPHGTHKIKWLVEDACGNAAFYEKAFTVIDSIVLEPEPCDNISTSFASTSTGQNCCATITVHNQLPNYFSAVQISVLSGASLYLSDVTPGAGWKVGGFSNGTSVTLKPTAGGTIPTGNLNCAVLCLSKLTAADQYIEIQYLSANGDTTCTDTLHFTCDYCISIVSDSIACDSAGWKKMTFCVHVAPGIGWNVNSIVLMPPTGVTASPASFSLPNVPPGGQYCYLTTYLSLPSGTNPDSICIGFTAHEQDVTTGLPPLRCCMVDACLVLPDCLCDPDITFATVQPAQLGDKDCCWDITLHQPLGVIYSVQTNILTPGVTYSAASVNALWDLQIRSPQDYVWTPDAGGTLPASIALPTLCLDVPLGSPSPQLVEIVWYANDSTICHQILEFNCRANDPCITVDSAQATCVTIGTASLSVTVTNTSNPPVFGGEVVLTPIGPAPFTLTPSSFIVSLAPGASITLNAVATGVTSSELWFSVHLHQTAGDTSHQTCCVALDTLKVEIEDHKAPTITCANGLSVNLPFSGLIEVPVSDWVLGATDDCSTDAQIQYGIRRPGTGTGFPTGQSSLTFTCDDLGLQPVEVWAMDAAGNADFCLTYIIIQDNNGSCGNESEGFQLYQNQPNPWSEQTRIGFRVPEDTEATLRIFDAMGRTLHTQSGFFKEGENRFELKDWRPTSTGVLFYSVETPRDFAARRMVVGKH